MIPKVLIVDDEPAICFILKIFLQRLGCSPMVAANGLEAEAVVEELQPDLVLLDVMMPQQDGYETCRNLRRKGFVRPIILMSASPTRLVLHQVKECGADDYLEKPITTDTLKRFITIGSTQP